MSTHDVQPRKKDAPANVPVRVARAAEPAQEVGADDVAQLAARALGVGSALLVHHAPEGRRVVGVVGLDAESARRATGSPLLDRDDPFFVADAASERRLLEDPLVADRHRLVAMAPVRDAAGARVGTLVLLDARPKDRLDMELLAMCARQAVPALRALARTRAQDGSASGAPVESVQWRRVVDSLEATVARLRESEHRHVQILDSVPDMILCTAADGGLVYANAAARAFADVPAAASAPDADDATVLRTGRPLEIPDEHRTSREGEARVLHTVKAPLRDTQGNVVQVVSVSRDVTDSKGAEERRRQLLVEVEHQRRRLDSIIASVPGVVWETRGPADPAQQRVEFVSEHAETMLGHEREAWLSTPGFLLEIVHAEDRARVAGELSEALAHGRGATQCRWMAKDGRAVWVLMQCVAVRDAQGRPVGMRGVALDVSDRRRAEEASRASESRYRLLAENSLDIISRHGRDGAFRYASPAAKSVLGWSPEELVGRPLLDLVHPDDATATRAFQAALLEKPDYRTHTFRWRRRDGSYAWVETHAGTVRDAGGEAGEIVAVTRDVTERKEAEDALRLKEERFRSLVKAASQIVWTASPSGEVVEDSPSWRAFTGQTFEEWRGAGWLDAIHPDDRKRTEAVWREAVRRRTRYEIKYRLRRADGSYAIMLACGVPVLGADGTVREIVGMNADITEQEQAAEALRESHEHVRTILESISDAFLALDEEWRFTYLNPMAEELLGRSREDLLGKVLWEEYPDTVGSRFHDEYLRVARERQPAQFEAYYPGHERWYEVRAFPAAQGISVYFRDTTHRRQAEDALRESEARYRFLADSVPDQVWTARSSGEIDYVNGRVAEYFGAASREMLEGGWTRVAHPDDATGAQQRWRRSVEKGEPFEAELRLRRHDGAWRWHIARAVAQRDASGSVTKWFGSCADIHDHKEAQDALQKRARDLARLTEELRYQTQLVKIITDNAGSALFMMDKKGHPIFMNPAACAMTGYASVDEIRGKPLHDSIHFKRPDGSHYPMEECPIDQANAEIVPLRNQREVFCRKDGSLFPVEYNVAPVERSGHQLGAVIEVRDITEDLAREKALEDQTRVLATINRVNASLAAELDVDRLVQAVTDAGTEVTGAQFGAFFYNRVGEDGESYMLYSLSGVPRERFEKFPMPRATDLFRPTFDGEGIVRLDDVTKDPRYGRSPPHHGLPKGHLPVRSYLAAPVVSRSGRVLGGLFFGHEDPGVFSAESEQLLRGIAHQASIALDNANLFRRSQQELEARQRAEKEAEKQRTYLQSILDSAGEGIYAIDLDGHTTMTNQAAARMLGYEPEEMLGSDQHRLIHHHRPDGAPHDRESCAIVRSMREGSPRHVRDEVFWRKDGTSFPVEYISTPLTEDGRITGAVVMFQDVSDRVEAEEALKRRAEQLATLALQLERSNAELDQFAYVTSHDLKAPLRGIANLSRWIEEDLHDRLDDESRRNLELLRGRVNRMEALINAILEYSRVGRKRTQVQTVDVGAMLHEVKDLLAPPETYEVHISPGMPTLVVERMRLQQVFMNLVGNAIKHGGPTGRVEVSCEDAGDMVRFTVKDDGPGIAPRYHEKVFTIFQTLEARDKVEGTGVGLALVKKIVESQGGSVMLDSDEGRGAAFTFTWPKQAAGAGLE